MGVVELRMKQEEEEGAPSWHPLRVLRLGVHTAVLPPSHPHTAPLPAHCFLLLQRQERTLMYGSFILPK